MVWSCSGWGMCPNKNSVAKEKLGIPFFQPCSVKHVQKQVLSMSCVVRLGRFPPLISSGFATFFCSCFSFPVPVFLGFFSCVSVFSQSFLHAFLCACICLLSDCCFAFLSSPWFFSASCVLLFSSCLPLSLPCTPFSRPRIFFSASCLSGLQVQLALSDSVNDEQRS